MNFIQGSKLALVGVALLALALGGCGRRSKLDLPPQAAAEPAPAAGQDAPTPPPRRNSLGLFDAEEEDRPIAAQGKKRRIILDNILD